MLVRELPGGRYSRSQVCQIAGDVLRGLGHCHEKFVFHRDITQTNVGIFFDDCSMRAKLLDFGSACHLEAQELSGDACF